MLRHVGVFCVLIALAMGASWFLPISQGSELPLLGAMFVFALYFGISLILARKKAPTDE